MTRMDEYLKGICESERGKESEGILKSNGIGRGIESNEYISM
jgi:hypothetical protein